MSKKWFKEPKRKYIGIGKMTRRKATPEEIIEYNAKIAKQMEKFERDEKCGGSAVGMFVRLHDRHWEERG